MRTLLCLGFLIAICRAEDPAIPALEAATRDPDRGVRFAAVEALGKAGTGIDAVVAALDDPEWCVRQAAGRALSNIGESALPALVRVYKSGKPQARIEAVEAARRIGAKGAALVLAALDDEDAGVRREALDGVALIGKVDWTPAQIARLRKLADSEEMGKKLNACMALRDGDPGARAFIESQIDDLRVMIEPKTLEHEWLGGLEAWLKPPLPPAPPLIDLNALAALDEYTRGQELAKTRRIGVGFKQHEDAIAKLLDAEDIWVARDAAEALECIGADALGRVIDRALSGAAYLCKDPTEANRKAILLALESEDSDDKIADWILLLGRLGLRDEEIEQVLRDAAKSNSERVRANAVWALGQIGSEVPEALGDRSVAVREVALPFLKNVRRLIAILNGPQREARMLAARRLGELEQYDALLAVSSHRDPLLRIAVAQALGERCPAVYYKDEARDVRIAAASVLRGPVLLSMLKDENWRVRAAAVRSLGYAKLGIDELAALLGSRNYAIGVAAFESLRRIGPTAALAVARAADNGNEAVWHYEPKLFESFGGAGAAGVAPLAVVLNHPNPTARETAARCIGAVGPEVVGAAPALIEALADRRLGVVAHAALALGRIGDTDALVKALADKRTRVRAYSAFALGWALGAKRGFDQAFFEPRLPVLDCGEPEPKLTVEEARMVLILDKPEARRIARAGIWSKDPKIAYPCVSVLDYGNMNARECERAVELVIAEGFRKGHPFDFDFFRSYVGSNELPACIQIMNYARDCDPHRRSIYGDFHRSSRADTIPALLWFDRNEDAIRLEGISELGQPFGNCEQYRVLRSTGGLWADVERDGYLSAPQTWWLESEPIPESRESELIALADVREGKSDANQWPTEQRWVAMRALGRARGGASLRYLRWASGREDFEAVLALVSLVRRGDPDALVRLIERSREESALLSLLIEARPHVGMAVCRDRLANPSQAEACARDLSTMIDEGDALYGVRWNPDQWVGVEPAIPVEVLGLDALGAIARWVPGCRTRRIAAAILDRLEESASPAAWQGDDAAVDMSFLDQVDPARARRLLRADSGSEEPAESLGMLARIQDPDDEARMIRWIVEGDGPFDDVLAWRTPGIAKALRERDEPDPDELIASQCGFRPCLDEEEDDDTESTETVVEVAQEKRRESEAERFDKALRAGEGLAAARALLAAHVDRMWELGDDVGPRWPWMKAELERRYAVREYGHLDPVLGQLATWDPEARAEYWSILRAGRYRWVNDWQETHGMTLGFDLATLPFWAEELESNCCRINPRIDRMFDGLFGIGDLYGCADYGIGQPPSRRVRSWFELYGGQPRWSRIARMCLPEPE